MRKTRLEIYDEFPNSLVTAAIEEWIKSERDRRILKYKLIDNYTYERIAELEELSSKRVQDIIYSAEPKLYKHLLK